MTVELVGSHAFSRAWRENFEDTSPVVAGVSDGQSMGQHAASTFRAAENALGSAHNLVLEQIGLKTAPASNLP